MNDTHVWLDAFVNDGRRMLCQVKGCDHQATLLSAQVIWDGYRVRCTALCQDHAARSLERDKPVLQLVPIRIVEATDEVNASVTAL